MMIITVNVYSHVNTNFPAYLALFFELFYFGRRSSKLSTISSCSQGPIIVKNSIIFAWPYHQLSYRCQPFEVRMIRDSFPHLDAPNRPVDESRWQDFRVGLSQFSSHPISGESTRCSGFLTIVDSQWNKVQGRALSKLEMMMTTFEEESHSALTFTTQNSLLSASAFSSKFTTWRICF